MLSRLVRLIISFVFLLSFFQSLSQKTKQASVLIDSLVLFNKLDNGFSYYVRKNQNAEKAIEIRFVLRGGEMQEDSNEFEVSHLIEHVALRGSKNFPTGFNSTFNQDGLRIGDNFKA